MKRILRGGKERDRHKSDAELGGEMQLTELLSPQSDQPSTSTQEGVATVMQLESGAEEVTPPPSHQLSIHQGEGLPDNDGESADSHLGSSEEVVALPSSTRQSTHAGHSIPENDEMESLRRRGR